MGETVDEHMLGSSFTSSSALSTYFGAFTRSSPLLIILDASTSNVHGLALCPLLELDAIHEFPVQQTPRTVWMGSLYRGAYCRLRDRRWSVHVFVPGRNTDVRMTLTTDYLQYTVTSPTELPITEFTEELKKAAEELYELFASS